MACPSAAKKSGSSHLSWVVAFHANQTAFVPELLKAVTFFGLMSYPGEIAHLNSAKREISNDVWLVKLC